MQQSHQGGVSGALASHHYNNAAPAPPGYIAHGILHNTIALPHPGGPGAVNSPAQRQHRFARTPQNVLPLRNGWGLQAGVQHPQAGVQHPVSTGETVTLDNSCHQISRDANGEINSSARVSSKHNRFLVTTDNEYFGRPPMVHYSGESREFSNGHLNHSREVSNMNNNTRLIRQESNMSVPKSSSSAGLSGASPSLSSQLSTNTASPLGEKEILTDDQIMDFILRRLKDFSNLCPKMRSNGLPDPKEGQTWRSREEDTMQNQSDCRSITPKADCVVLPPATFDHLVGTQGFLDTGEKERQGPGCCVIVGEAREEYSSKAELSQRVQKDDCVGSTADKHSTEYPQIMQNVAATCTKNEDESPVVLNAVSGMTLDELTKEHPNLTVNCSPLQEEYKSVWLNINKNLDDIDGEPGAEGARCLKPAEAMELEKVLIVTNNDSEVLEAEALSENQSEDVMENIESQIELSIALPENECEEQAPPSRNEREGSTSLERFEVPQYEDVTDDETSNSQAVTSGLKSGTPISEYNRDKSPSRSHGHGREQALAEMKKDGELMPQKQLLLRTENHDSAQICICPYYVETDDGFVKQFCPKCETERELGQNTKDSGSCSPPLLLRGQDGNLESIYIPPSVFDMLTADRLNSDTRRAAAPKKPAGQTVAGLQYKGVTKAKTSHYEVVMEICEDKTEDEGDEDGWMIITAAISDLAFQSTDINQGSPERIAPDYGETGQTKPAPVSTSCDVEEFETVELFLQAKRAQLMKRVVSIESVASRFQSKYQEETTISSGRRSTPLIEKESESEPYRVDSESEPLQKESVSEPHTLQKESEREPHIPQYSSSDTEDSADYAVTSRAHNCLKVSRQSWYKRQSHKISRRSAARTSEKEVCVPGSESESEDDNLTRFQKRQRVNAPSESASLDNSGCMKISRQLTESKSGPECIRPKIKRRKGYAVESETESESEQNVKMKAKRRKFITDGSVDSADDSCTPQNRTAKEKPQQTRLSTKDSRVPQYLSVVGEESSILASNPVISRLSKKAAVHKRGEDETQDSEHPIKATQINNCMPQLLTDEKGMFVSNKKNASSRGCQKTNPSENEAQATVGNKKGLSINCEAPSSSKVKRFNSSEARSSSKVKLPKSSDASSSSNVQKSIYSKASSSSKVQRSNSTEVLSSSKVQKSIYSEASSSSKVQRSNSTEASSSSKVQKSIYSKASSSSKVQKSIYSKASSSSKVQRSNSTEASSSSKVQRSNSSESPSASEHPSSPTKGPLTSSMTSKARQLVTDNWQSSFVSNRRAILTLRRRNSTGIEDDFRTSPTHSKSTAGREHSDAGREARSRPSHHDRPPRQRHNSHDSAKPLMKRSLLEANRYRRATQREAKHEQSRSVGEGYKWAEKLNAAHRRKASKRRSKRN